MKLITTIIRPEKLADGLGESVNLLPSERVPGSGRG